MMSYRRTLWAIADKHNRLIASDDGRLFIYEHGVQAHSVAEDQGYEVIKVRVEVDE